VAATAWPECGLQNAMCLALPHFTRRINPTVFNASDPQPVSSKPELRFPNRRRAQGTHRAGDELRPKVERSAWRIAALGGVRKVVAGLCKAH
jgi:hypothetical protein